MTKRKTTARRKHTPTAKPHPRFAIVPKSQLATPRRFLADPGRIAFPVTLTKHVKAAKAFRDRSAARKFLKAHPELQGQFYYKRVA